MSPEPMGLYRRLATSEETPARLLRGLRRWAQTFSVPAPRMLTKPLLAILLALRGLYAFTVRVFICEPLFKAHCESCGRRLRTDCHLHWVSGLGDIVIGDDVWLDGKISITFAARFADRPRLEVGDNTGVGDGCEFIIGRRISIGRNCILSGNILVMDSNGHHSDPQERLIGRPPDSDDVRPVVIGNNVWIGKRCIIFPGVQVGEGSVISAGSVVRSHVPPLSVVAGNPARVMFRLKTPAEPESAS